MTNQIYQAFTYSARYWVQLRLNTACVDEDAQTAAKAIISDRIDFQLDPVVPFLGRWFRWRPRNRL